MCLESVDKLYIVVSEIKTENRFLLAYEDVYLHFCKNMYVYKGTASRLELLKLVK